MSLRTQANPLAALRGCTDCGIPCALGACFRQLRLPLQCTTQLFGTSRIMRKGDID